MRNICRCIMPVLIIIVMIMPGCGKKEAPDLTVSPAVNSLPSEIQNTDRNAGEIADIGPEVTAGESSNNNTDRPDYKDWLKEQIDKDVYSCSLSEIKENMDKWVNAYIEVRLDSLGIQGEPEAVYAGSASFGEFISEHTILPFNYSCRAITNIPSEKAIKQEDGTYALEFNIYPVAVEHKGTARLVGIIDNDGIKDFDVLREAYDIVFKSKKYSDALSDFPETENSGNISSMNLSELIQDKVFPTGKFVLPDDKLAVLGVYGAVREKDGRYNLTHIYIIDMKSKKLAVRPVEIEPCTWSRIYSEGDKLLIDTFSSDYKDIITLEVDTKTPAVIQRHRLTQMESPMFSPDGTKIAYSNKGSLYVCSSALENPRLLVEGNDSQGQDRKYYYPFKWADNDRIIYNIGGYEWSEGCGFVSLTDGKNHPFDSAGPFAFVVFSSGSMVYTSTGEMGAAFDPGYIDINDDKLTFKKVFGEKFSLNKENDLSYGFSPDGSKLALLKTNMSPYEKTILYICSTEDGSIMKKYEFSSGMCRPQYINFFENDTLMLFSERYAYSPEYCFKVDLAGDG